MYCHRPLIYINDIELSSLFGGKRFISWKWFNKQNLDFNQLLRSKKICSYGCGNCSHCINMRRYQWVRKMELERSNWKNVYMLTLTYDNDHLPGDGCLSVHDLQKFFKRLRKCWGHMDPLSNTWIKDYDFRYFATGEYGTKTNRPHYHIVLFTNYDFILCPLKKTKNGTVYYSAELNKLWPNGFNSVIHCLSSSAFVYAATYSNKCFLKQELNLRYKNLQKEIRLLVDCYGSSFKTHLLVEQLISNFLATKFKPEFYCFSKSVPLGSEHDDLTDLPISLVKYRYKKLIEKKTKIKGCQFKSFEVPLRYSLKQSRSKDKLKKMKELHLLYGCSDELKITAEFQLLNKKFKEYKKFIETNDLQLLVSGSKNGQQSYEQLKKNSSFF